MSMISPPLFVRPVAPADWPDVSAAFSDLTYEQTLTYGCAAAERIGADAEFLAIRDQTDQVVAAACLRIKRVPGLGRGIAWVPAGPLMQRRNQSAAESNMLRHVLVTLRAYTLNAGHILRLRFPVSASHDNAEIDSIAAQEGFRPTDRAPAYRTVAIDCRQDEDTLMQALHGKWRNPLRNALQSELDLETAPIAECSERFHALYRDVQQTKGFSPDIPPEFYYALDGPDFEHDVLIARKDGRDVAGMTVGRAGCNAVYLFGATSEAGRRLNAGYYLMWQAILRCRALGIRWFDLGGIDPGTNPGVTRFKQRTGGKDICAPGPYEVRSSGPVPTVIRAAEALHTRMKTRR